MGQGSHVLKHLHGIFIIGTFEKEITSQLFAFSSKGIFILQQIHEYVRIYIYIYINIYGGTCLILKNNYTNESRENFGVNESNNYRYFSTHYDKL